jgi:hypothetical protein
MSPAMAPQLPHTLDFETRTSSPHGACSSMTSWNGMYCATSSANAR